MENQQHPVIAKLLKRMDDSPGFAGLGASIQIIAKLGEDDEADNREITSAILRDAALTAKLLRFANSSRRGGRNVSTIDQAIAILGLNTVKSVALSLALLNSLSNKPQSNLLYGEIVSSYFCGILAAQLTRQNAPRFNAQEAQVCGLMQNLGRMMATYFLYDEIERIRLVQAEKNLPEEDAVLETFGIGFDDMGAAIAEHWQLPDVLLQSLSAKVDKIPPRPSPTAIGWHQLCSLYARRITDIVFRLPENRERIEIGHAIEFFRTALQLREHDCREMIGKTLEETEQTLADMGFPCNVEQARALLRKSSERVMDVLSAEDRLTRSEDGVTPIETIQQVIRLIHDANGFDRTLLCVPDGSSGLLGIVGVGRNAAQVTSKFRCFGQKPDLFRIVMIKKVDLQVADTSNPAYVKFIPDWYTEHFAARSFVALSLIADDKFFGLLYGDFATPQTVSMPAMTQGKMKEWRDLLLTALQTGLDKK